MSDGIDFFAYLWMENMRLAMKYSSTLDLHIEENTTAAYRNHRQEKGFLPKRSMAESGVFENQGRCSVELLLD